MPPQAKLLITILDDASEAERQAERRAWIARSRQAMSRVFGDDEPEYSAADAIP